MNWDNIEKIMRMYTQFKHYQILFEKYNIPKKGSGKEMLATLKEEVFNGGLLLPLISNEEFQDWIAYHQIDGNNYNYVYYLKEKTSKELMANLFSKQNELVKFRLWDVNIDTESGNVDKKFSGTELIKVLYDAENKRYIFSYIAPCIVTGKDKVGQTRIYKKIFFAHCVLYEEGHYCKVVFNPTANLIEVDGVQKENRTDWSPIADMFFNEVQKLIGKQILNSPNWLPQALHKFAEEASDHNNPTIHEYSFRVEEEISNFARNILISADINVELNNALHTKLTQDIQQSFESQLVEKYGIQDDQNSFSLFKQRSDGVVHNITVESIYGLRKGVAAQAARRSRTDNDIDLVGVILSLKGKTYKFLVECGLDAYLIRGNNAFIEEEVVDIVIRKLNEYRDEIQSAVFNNQKDRTGDPIFAS
ncbi:hypothetical protein CXK86_20105 [Paenibacillus sp. BGI2013]|uniref:hypothetical protein n=1 Tax=Paenibacillus sp. BGI2013 TaxID=2058902 RepID=UPI000C6EF6C4|nr:hypothetical protein [Paenibacillus sp. BGI2013]PKQ89356.1 hypothetical protein CXK86_20105 [Paenibacillus sp. BGI2013]